MKHYNYADCTDQQIDELCKRPRIDFRTLFSEIEPIIEDVAKEGDDAVNRYNEKFDGVRAEPLTLDPSTFRTSLDEDVRRAIDTAYENISTFHESQRQKPVTVETMQGVTCMQRTRPIENVGLYIPGGTAVLPSTALMLGIPAQLAGCSRIVMATPPRPDGSVHEVIRYIAKRIGASHLLAAGGAQAIAAMAQGTESVPSVDKLFGPGNQYVTAAKMLLQNSDVQVSIDMPAGPSEVLVIADSSANPRFVAADLLSQAEHGTDSQVVLVHTADFDKDALDDELESQLDRLPRRSIASEAIEHSFSIEVETIIEAFHFSNSYAPEHLIIQCEEAEGYIDRVHHAGSVFLGSWSPESVGDYASGTNHTLPTYGYARMYSGVSLHSFMKQITFQQLSEQGLRTIAPTVQTLAGLEELEAHKKAVEIRLDN